MNIPVRTLLCNRDVDTGIKCLSSAKDLIAEGVRFEIFDDGTLTSNDKELLKNALGEVRIIGKNERDSDIKLKLKSFPCCAKFREAFPLGMKLFDCSLFEKPDWVNYLDSDILFLRKVTGLFSSESSSLFMEDVDNAYSLRIRSFLSSPPLMANINTGVMRFPSGFMKLDVLEKFLSNKRVYSDLMRTTAWAEQTCFGMLAALEPTRLIDHRDGVVISKHFREEAKRSAILLHVVSSYRRLLDSLLESACHDAGPRPLREVRARRLNGLSYLFTVIKRSFASLRMTGTSHIG